MLVLLPVSQVAILVLSDPKNASPESLQRSLVVWVSAERWCGCPGCRVSVTVWPIGHRITAKVRVPRAAAFRGWKQPRLPSLRALQDEAGSLTAEDSSSRDSS